MSVTIQNMAVFSNLTFAEEALATSGNFSA
jgi:hypothetical protein